VVINENEFAPKGGGDKTKYDLNYNIDA